MPRLLHSCYLVALHEELKQHHGENQGKVLFQRVLQVGVRFDFKDNSERSSSQVLDLLTPLAESYQQHVGSRLVQGESALFSFSIKHTSTFFYLPFFSVKNDEFTCLSRKSPCMFFFFVDRLVIGCVCQSVCFSFALHHGQDKTHIYT